MIKFLIAYDAVLSLVPNLSAIAEYLSKLAMNQRNIKRRSSRGICGEPPVEPRHKMPDTFCCVHISVILHFKHSTLTLLTLKKVLYSSMRKLDTTFPAYILLSMPFLRWFFLLQRRPARMNIRFKKYQTIITFICTKID